MKEMDVGHAQLALDAVKAGEEVVLTEDGRAVALLVPVGAHGAAAPHGPGKAGSTRGVFPVPNGLDQPVFPTGGEIRRSASKQVSSSNAVPDVPDRVPGSARGLLTIRDDFDDPVDDFRDYV